MKTLHKTSVKTSAGAILVRIGQLKTLYCFEGMESESLTKVIDFAFSRHKAGAAKSIAAQKATAKVLKKESLLFRQLWSASSAPKSVDHLLQKLSDDVNVMDIELRCQGESCNETCGTTCNDWTNILDAAAEALTENEWDEFAYLCPECVAREAALEAKINAAEMAARDEMNPPICQVFNVA